VIKSLTDSTESGAVPRFHWALFPAPCHPVPDCARASLRSLHAVAHAVAAPGIAAWSRPRPRLTEEMAAAVPGSRHHERLSCSSASVSPGADGAR